MNKSGTNKLRLRQIGIVSLCSSDWENMHGDERVRHCGSCNKNVFNLSAMTEEEAVALVNANRDDLCIRLYRRQDGTVMTSDCGAGLRERAHTMWRKLTGLAASFFVVFSFAGCSARQCDPAVTMGESAARPGDIQSGIKSSGPDAPSDQPVMMMGAPMPTFSTVPAEAPGGARIPVPDFQSGLSPMQTGRVRLHSVDTQGDAVNKAAK